MNLKDFFREIKNFFSELYNYQKTGSMLNLHFSEDGNFEFKKYYSPSFFNNGTSTVKLDHLTIPPGGIIAWENIPFAISQTKVSFKFINTGNQTNDLVISYGVLHSNNP